MSIGAVASDGGKLANGSPGVGHGGDGIDWVAQAMHPNYSIAAVAVTGGCVPSFALKVFRPFLRCMPAIHVF